jgi:hypothetical protein
MGKILSCAGIVMVLIGAWLVAYEVVAKFEGETHGVSTTYGGGKAFKLGVFKEWEMRKNKYMWAGLIFITIGSFLQIAGVLV